MILESLHSTKRYAVCSKTFSVHYAVPLACSSICAYQFIQTMAYLGWCTALTQIINKLEIPSFILGDSIIIPQATHQLHET